MEGGGREEEREKEVREEKRERPREDAARRGREEGERRGSSTELWSTMLLLLLLLLLVEVVVIFIVVVEVRKDVRLLLLLPTVMFGTLAAPAGSGSPMPTSRCDSRRLAASAASDAAFSAAPAVSAASMRS